MIQITRGELNGFLKVLLAIAVVLLICLLFYGLWLLRSLLLLFLISLVFVFLVRPMVDFLSRGSFKVAKKKKVQLKLPRVLSIVISFLVIITIMVWIIIPASKVIGTQVTELADTFQQLDVNEIKNSVEGWIVNLTLNGEGRHVSNALTLSYGTAIDSIENRISVLDPVENADEIEELDGIINDLQYQILVISPSASISETIDTALQNLSSWLSSLATSIISGTVNLVGKIANGIFNGLIILIITIFLLLDWDLANAVLFSIFPNKTGNVVKGVLANVYEKIWTYVRAQSLLSATTGILVGLMCAILGLPSAFIIGVIVAFGEMVPYVGPILSFTLGLLLAFASAIPTGNWSIILYYSIGFIIIEQTIDLLISKPLFAKVTQTHPLLIVFVMFAFSTLFGPFAILLAIPFLVFVKAIFEYFRQNTDVFAKFGIAVEPYESKVPSLSESALLKKLRKPFSRLKKK